MLSWDGAAPAVVSAGRRPPPADGAPAGPPTPTPSQRTSHALIAQEVLACLPPAGSYPPQVLATALGVAELRLKSLKVWEDVTVEGTGGSDRPDSWADRIGRSGRELDTILIRIMLLDTIFVS